MRRRSAFTLIEMLVSVALVLFIMVILTEAFGKGLESFRQMKAIGDMEARLRSAAAILTRDLAMDHFEGKRRLSDDVRTWNMMGPPREGFVYLRQGPPQLRLDEGADADGVGSRRRVDHFLHMAVKARGNDRANFFAAQVLAPELFGRDTTFFNHPKDARFQDTQNVYTSQWAEVAYRLHPTGTTEGNVPLHTLYRSQLVVVPNNVELNWDNPTKGTTRIPAAKLAQFREVSCQIEGSYLYFNSPGDLATRTVNGVPSRALRLRDPNDFSNLVATPILSDVVSFDLQISHGSDWMDFPSSIATDGIDSRTRSSAIVAVKVTLRVFDPKSKLTRQMTVIQDL